PSPPLSSTFPYATLFRSDLQELRRPRRDPVFREIPNPADVSEELRRGQVFGQRRGLRHVAQLGLVADRIREDVVASYADGPVVRSQEPDEDLQCRCLARAIRADQAEDLARVRFERKALQSRLAVVRFPEL